MKKSIIILTAIWISIIGFSSCEEDQLLEIEQIENVESTMIEGSSDSILEGTYLEINQSGRPDMP